MARRKGPLAELKRGLRKMTPNRVAARLISGGKHQTLGSIVKAPLKAPRTYGMADEARLTPAQRAVPLSERGRGGARKRADPYAAAAAIPARNRAQAAKRAAAARKAAGGKAKQQHVQGKDGKMQGSVTLPGADLTLYRQAQQGDAVIQPGEPNRRRL